MIDNQSFKELYKSLDKDQNKMFNSIIENKMTCCDAKAGTGKTTIAVMAAFKLLGTDVVNKIIYIRFPDKMVQSLGAFPGELVDKEKYYMQPFFDACKELDISEDLLYKQYIPTEQVQLMTNITLRGSNFKDSAVIIDEAQNATFKDLKLVLTRLHDSCHSVLIGHVAQCDNKNADKEEAFTMYIDHLCKKSWSKKIVLKNNYRGEVSKWADSLVLTPNGYIVDRQQ